MKKYCVEVAIQGKKVYEVMAEDEETAIDFVQQGKAELTLDKTYAVDYDAWEVKEEEI